MAEQVGSGRDKFVRPGGFYLDPLLAIENLSARDYYQRSSDSDRTEQPRQVSPWFLLMRQMFSILHGEKGMSRKKVKQDLKTGGRAEIRKASTPTLTKWSIAFNQAVEQQVKRKDGAHFKHPNPKKQPAIELTSAGKDYIRKRYINNMDGKRETFEILRVMDAYRRQIREKGEYQAILAAEAEEAGTP